MRCVADAAQHGLPRSFSIHLTWEENYNLVNSCVPASSTANTSIIHSKAFIFYWYYFQVTIHNVVGGWGGGGGGGDVAPVAIWMAADSELIISLYDKSVIIFCGAVTHFTTSAQDSQRNGEDSPSVRHIFYFFLFLLHQWWWQRY